MMRRVSDGMLSWGLLAAGGALLVAGLARNPSALHLQAGMDGCFAVGLVALLLALLQGLPYRTALVLVAPVVVIQLVGCRVYQASPLAVVGLEAVIAGAVGLAIGIATRTAPRPVPRAIGGHDERGAERPQRAPRRRPAIAATMVFVGAEQHPRLPRIHGSS